MDDPNPDDPLVTDIADLLNSDKEKHDENAKLYTLRFATEFSNS